jgi:hypothetical protein
LLFKWLMERDDDLTAREAAEIVNSYLGSPRDDDDGDAESDDDADDDADADGDDDADDGDADDGAAAAPAAAAAAPAAAVPAAAAADVARLTADREAFEDLLRAVLGEDADLRQQLSDMSLAERFELLQLVDTQRAGTAPPTNTRLHAPCANARVHACAADIHDLKGMHTSTTAITDRAAWERPFAHPDAVRSTLARSSFAHQTPESIIVKGTATHVRVRSSKRAAAARAKTDRDALLAAARDWDTAPAEDVGLKFWRLRCFEQALARLFPTRSYMSDVMLAWRRERFSVDALSDLLNALDDNVKPSASEAGFGLGQACFDELVAEGPLSPCSLRCGKVFPQRVLVEGLVGVRTMGELRRLLRDKIWVVGDTGVKVMLTCIIARARLDLSSREWTSTSDEVALDEATVRRLLMSLQFDYVVRKIHASRRFRVPRDVAGAAARAAAEALSKEALVTGGHRARDPQLLLEYQRAFVGRFLDLYRASMRRALAGSMHHQLRTMKKRRAADVSALVQAVAEFRVLIALQDGATLDDNAIGRIFRPATKFDDGVLVVLGQPTFSTSMRGFRPTPAKAFVEALSKVYTLFAISEYNTSKRCWCCGATLERAPGAPSYRNWICPHHPEHVFNKDVGASLSMLRLALLLFSTGKRPDLWCSPDQVLRARADQRGGDDEDDDHHDDDNDQDDDDDDDGQRKAKKGRASGRQASSGKGKRSGAHGAGATQKRARHDSDPAPSASASKPQLTQAQLPPPPPQWPVASFAQLLHESINACRGDAVDDVALELLEVGDDELRLIADAARLAAETPVRIVLDDSDDDAEEAEDDSDDEAGDDYDDYDDDSIDDDEEVEEDDDDADDGDCVGARLQAARKRRRCRGASDAEAPDPQPPDIGVDVDVDVAVVGGVRVHLVVPRPSPTDTHSVGSGDSGALSSAAVVSATQPPSAQQSAARAARSSEVAEVGGDSVSCTSHSAPELL